MKLFVWNKAFPGDWQGGLAFAIAETEDQARALIAEKIEVPLDFAMAEYGLNNPPDVVHELDRPFAGYCMGKG